MKVGIIYNIAEDTILKPITRNPEIIDTETITCVEKALNKNHDTELIDVDKDFFNKIKTARIDLAFNLSYGLQGESRQSQVPSMLEMTGIPYTGSDPLGHAIALDKPLAKKLFQMNQIMTPKYTVVEKINNPIHHRLKYPVVIKPACGSLHEGIKVTSSERAMKSWTRHVIKNYNQPALIEEYAACEEYTVCILGNENPLVLPIMHIKPRTRSKTPILKKGQKNDKTCPAILTRKQEKDIIRVAIKAYKTTKMKDVARIDLKLMDDGKVNVLEVNSNPGLHPKYSLLPRAARASGIKYNQLINQILDTTIKRYNL